MDSDRIASAPADCPHQRESSLEQALTAAFWRAVRNDPLPIMAALEAAARALGSLYRMTAEAHGPGSVCGCGWQPDPEADLIVLEAMLAASATRAPVDDLSNMTIAGRA